MIEHINLQIHAALTGVGEARRSVRLSRSQDGRDALVHQLAKIEAVLESAVADLSSDLHHDDQDGGRAMERRALLKLTGAIAATAFTPLDSVERIAGALENPGRVDDRLLDAYDEVTTSYAEAFYSLPPAQLAAPVRAHLDRLVALTAHPAAPAVRTRLEAMVSDAAAFAGMIAYDLDQPGAARSSLALAADAAQQAGDATLHALAVAMQARVHALIAPATRRAGTLLDQAFVTLPDQASPQARRWVAVQYATDCATTGDELGYQAAIETARAAAPPEPLTTGFLSDTGWYRTGAEPHWLDQNRAHGLVALQHRSAEPLLLEIIDNTTDPRMRANASNSLATFYAARGEVEDACHAALRTLDLATAHGLTSAIRKTRTTREHLNGHDRNPTVRDLDAALAAA